MHVEMAATGSLRVLIEVRLEQGPMNGPAWAKEPEPSTTRPAIYILRAFGSGVKKMPERFECLVGGGHFEECLSHGRYWLATGNRNSNRSGFASHWQRDGF